MGGHLPVMLPGDRVGCPFGTFFEHARTFNKFVCICHGHLAGNAIYPKIWPGICPRTPGHGVLIIGWRLAGILKRDATDQTAIEARTSALRLSECCSSVAGARI